ncbi:hypothetical protein HK105_207283 [Polyrhizophydium stewartii]|uniref:Tetraspanin n=1 Tax=Polyrhizophydium stewartii TaxID=2732419 RepID=A0ABR4N0X2_9FUNG|nr:hypothetical protein HK105_005353 [Polyrhizophydium stewartii]
MSFFRSCMNVIGRIWLVLINLGLLVVSGFAITSGVMLLRSAKSGDSVSGTLGTLTASANTKDIAACVLVFGCFFALTAIAGCIGGICAVSSFLSFYIGAVGLDLLMLLGLGGYALWKTFRARNEWMSVSVDQWKLANDQDKDFLQQAFQCCGYIKGDGTAYTGPTKYNATSTVNFCATDAATTTGCHDQGYSVYSGFAVLFLIVMVAGVIVCGISLAAANTARRKRELLQRGFQAAGRREVGPSGVKQPLMA